MEFIGVFEDLCWFHDRSTPYRSETNGIAVNTVRRVKEGTSASWFSQVFQKRCGEKRLNASVLCKTYKIYVQTESARMKQDFEFHFHGPGRPYGADCLKQNPVSTKDKRRLHQLGAKMLMNIHRKRAEFWRRLDRSLDFCGPARYWEIRRVSGSRPKIQFQRNRRQEIAGCTIIFHAQMVPWCKRSRSTPDLAPPKSQELRRKRSTLNIGRGLLTLCRAQEGDSVQYLRMFVELISMLWKVWKVSCMYLSFYRHHVTPREHK